MASPASPGVPYTFDLLDRVGFADMDLPRQAGGRMAYPSRPTPSPRTIGIPIPGGSFRLDPIPNYPDARVGELVYCGPNVMLGYAHGPHDLRLGRTVENSHRRPRASHPMLTCTRSSDGRAGSPRSSVCASICSGRVRAGRGGRDVGRR